MNATASGLAVIVAVLLLLGPNRSEDDVLVSVLIAVLFGFATWSALDLLDGVRKVARRK